MHRDGAPPSSLLVLGVIPPRGCLEERPIIRELSAWLSDERAPAALWVSGPPGSGRTCAVAEALRRAAPGGRHAKRVACSRGRCLEEVLDAAAVVLKQLGHDALDAVLGQRAFLTAKIEVLFQALREVPLVVWLDDFDALQAHGDGEKPAPAGLEHFLEGCLGLNGARGRVILTAESPPPGSFQSGGGIRARALRVDASLAPREGLETTVARLDHEAMSVLAAACVLPPDPTRQALREVAASLGVELKLRPESPDPPVLQAAEAGLLSVPAVAPGESWTGPPVAVPSAVRRFVERCLSSVEPDKWKALHGVAGSYWLRLAGRSGEVWHFLEAWRAFLAAEMHDRAYEVQKLFVHDVIHRGSLELARRILEETVRTSSGGRRTVALGNLALLYKSSGDHDGALELYGKVERELTALDDRHNLARVLHQIGNTYYLRGDHEAALESYGRSLEISAALGERGVAAATRVQVANVLFQANRKDEAVETYLRVLEDARLAEDHSLVAAVELQVGGIRLEEKRYVEASAHADRAEASARASCDVRTLVKVLETKGRIASERREYDAARAHFDGAVTAADALGDRVEGAAALALAGDVERTRLQFGEALRCYDAAVARLDGNSARAAEPGGRVGALRARIGERISELEDSLGSDTFRRLKRSLRGRAQSPRQEE